MENTTICALVPKGFLFLLQIFLLLGKYRWLNHGPSKMPTSCPQNHEYDALLGKRDLAGVLRILRWGNYPGLSSWAQCNHKNLLKSQRWRQDDGSRVRERFEDATLLVLRNVGKF